MENLASALLDYDSGFAMYERTAQTSVECVKGSVRELERALEIYLLQRQQRRTKAATHRRLHTKRLTEALQTLTTMVELL